MAINYPIPIPTAIGISQVTFSMVNTKTLSQSPFTGAQQQYVWPRQQWEVDVVIPPIQRQDGAEEWITFLAKLQAGTSTSFPSFHMSDPNGYPIGSQGTNFTVQSSGPNLIDLSGLQGGTNNVLAQGDYIRIGTGESARYHKVLDQVDSDSSGNAQASIWPSNKQAGPVEGSLQDAYGTFMMDNNSPSFTINDISSYGISFKARSLI